MPGAREVIKFVDEVAVVPSGIQVHCEFRGSDESYRQPRAREPGLGRLLDSVIVHSFIVGT